MTKRNKTDKKGISVTDQQTDKARCRDACTRLKRERELKDKDTENERKAKPEASKKETN